MLDRRQRDRTLSKKVRLEDRAGLSFDETVCSQKTLVPYMNILVNGKCSKKCAFCFQGENFRAMDNMPIAMFENIVEWLIGSYWVPNARVSVGILGGEPFLHPEFDAMLDYLIQRQNSLKNKYLAVNIITNGDFVEKHAQKLAQLKQLSFLLNAASMGSNDELARKLPIFSRLSKEVTLSYTVSNSSILEKLDFVFRAFPQFTFFRIGSSSSKDATTFEYYEENKKFLLEAYRHATINNKIISTDCSRIPVCAFTDDELRQMRSFRVRIDYDPNWLGAACIETCADIMPDGSIVHCVPLYDLTDRELKYHHFENCFQVYTYTARLIGDRIERKMSKSAKCMACIEYKTRRCYAGCLGMDIVP